MRVSILINNYNYGRFLARALDSALAQDHPDVEVLAVDDGSTDDSRDILARYAGRVQVFCKPNGGQASCYNLGFARSSGDIVLFLDSDDTLAPDLCSRLVAAWLPDCAKMQVRMTLIDEADRPLSPHLYPTLLHDGDVSAIVRRFGTYASPPGTANAYSRARLAPLMPMDEQAFRAAGDTYPLIAAAFAGRVCTLPGSGGGYRRHRVAVHGSPSFATGNAPAGQLGTFAAQQRAQRTAMRQALSRLGLPEPAPVRLSAPAMCRLQLLERRYLDDQPGRTDRSGQPEDGQPLRASQMLVAVLTWPRAPLSYRLKYLVGLPLIGWGPRWLLNRLLRGWLF